MTEKRKKKSGWDAWKAKKKAALATNTTSSVTTSTPDTVTPVTSRKTLRNHVAIVLDKSGSMEIIRDATIRAFNEQCSTIRTASKEQPTTVSLVTFDSTTRTEFFAVPTDKLTTLTRDSYMPGGGTALFDGIMHTTDALMRLPDANDPDTSFLVVIISDGEENSSRHATASSVKSRIESLQATKRWTFAYVGAVSDLTAIRNLGISAGNSRQFMATNIGVTRVAALNSTATQGYFASRSTGSTQSMDLYHRAEEALKKEEEKAAAAKGAIKTP